jgi:SAM-dependent methyltransferase
VSLRPGSVDFDAYANTYADAIRRSIGFSGQGHETFTRRKARYLLDLAARRLGDPAGLRVLDVGCGIGLTDQHLAGRFQELHGVDMATEAVHRAAVTNPSVFYQAYDGWRLPFGDASFDMAFAICVLHHVAPEQRPSFVAELRRVVRPGGIVAIFEHNPFNPLTRVAVSRCDFDEYAVLLTRRLASRLLAEAGLQAVERRYIIFLPFERRRTVAIERVLGWLPAAAQYYVASTR